MGKSKVQFKNLSIIEALYKKQVSSLKSKSLYRILEADKKVGSVGECEP